MSNIKKILSVTMLLAVVLPATSQSLRDYIRSRAGNADSLIMKAVSPALWIIRQQYHLERNGEFYGKNNRSFYGETYTLGVKISNFTLLQRGVVFPWEKDHDYIRVNAGGKYIPTYFRSMRRPINGLEWQDVDFDFGSQFTKPASMDSLLFLNQDKIADFGLTEDKTEGPKHGYMIWAYSTSDLQDSTMQVKLMPKAFSVEAKADSCSISVSPDNMENVLGGIFVVPYVERAGYIKILLLGMATLDCDNKWKLELLTEVTEKMTSSQKLSPKRKAPKEKKSKEKVDDSEPTPIK